MIEKLQKLLAVLLLGAAVWLVCDLWGEDILHTVDGLRQRLENTETGESAGAIEPDRGIESDGIPESAGETKLPAGKLPACYDSREAGRAPTVKNQGTLGTCWAVAASSALEAALLPKEGQVFSADHISLRNAYGKGQAEGGAYPMVVSYLAAWLGPVAEADDPYGDGVSPEGLVPVRHVQEMQLLQEKDLTAVKQLIYRCGAIQSSLYMDMEDSAHSSVYYNEFASAYCYEGEEAANHDVLIIGWDDTYPKSKFSVKVKRDGAFICQNSWGEDFGEKGVFYVSYEDALLGENCMAYTRVEDVENYKNIYQTDLCGWVGQIGYGSEECWFANVYTAEETGRLLAAGFYATDKNTEYEVYVAEDYAGTLSFLGKKKAAAGSFQNPGYYTVELQEDIHLEKGRRFAVAVKLRTPGSEYPVAAEYAADEDSKNITLEDGEGYLSSNGILWKRTEDAYGCNVCLKAYTGD